MSKMMEIDCPFDSDLVVSKWHFFRLIKKGMIGVKKGFYIWMSFSRSVNGYLARCSGILGRVIKFCLNEISYWVLVLCITPILILLILYIREAFSFWIKLLGSGSQIFRIGCERARRTSVYQ